MSQEELTPQERLIYHKGYLDGQKNGRIVAINLAIGFVVIFGLCIHLIFKSH